jgi:hypothetical protein
MCYMVSCPYVPPHTLEIDFPHLITRYKAIEHKKNNPTTTQPTQPNTPFFWPHERECNQIKTQDNVPRSLAFSPENKLHNLPTRVDLLAQMISPFATMVNQMLIPNTIFRVVMEKLFDVDRRARLPSYVTPKNQLSKLILFFKI